MRHKNKQEDGFGTKKKKWGRPKVMVFGGGDTIKSGLMGGQNVEAISLSNVLCGPAVRIDPGADTMMDVKFVSMNRCDCALAGTAADFQFYAVGSTVKLADAAHCS